MNERRVILGGAIYARALWRLRQLHQHHQPKVINDLSPHVVPGRVVRSDRDRRGVPLPAPGARVACESV